jgi:hypothetical protein
VEGIRLTVPHWYGFAPGVVTSRSAVLTDDEWDRLRESDAAFGFGTSRDEWMAKARSTAGLTERAHALARLLARWNATHVVSVGVGTGLFEFLVKTETPAIVMRCGDWSSQSLALLRERFLECDSIERMDLRDPTWAVRPGEVVLLNRVDMELTDGEWRRLFGQLAATGVRHIVLIPCGLLNAAAALSELSGLLAGIRRRRQIARSGFLRTPSRMRELFGEGYERQETVKSGDLEIWGLHLKDK